MRLQDVILASKTDLAVSEWGSGKFERKRFPLSKAGKRAYSLGSGWRWRFAEFAALDRRFVLRLIVCESKAIARAHLAMKVDGDCVVICCFEYHPDVVIGWHMHAICTDIDAAPKGTLVHGPWVRRLPGPRSPHRRADFYRDMHGGMEAWLWRQTMRFFRLVNEDPWA